MKKQRIVAPKLPARLKILLGLVAIAVLLAVLGASSGSSIFIPLTRSSNPRLQKAPELQQSASTPGSSIYLPLISNFSQASPPIEWKTYSNKQYGYAINFSPNMDVTERDDVTYFLIFGPTQRQGQDFHDGLLVAVSVSAAETTVAQNDFIEKQISSAEVFNPSVKIESTNKVALGQMEGVEVVGSEIGSKFVEIYLSNGGKILHVKANYSGEKSYDYLEVLYQMLSTLRLN